MSSTKCNVAVCQLTATSDKGRNLEIVKRLVAEAAEKDAKVVFLPEGCDYIGSNRDETRALAEPLAGPLVDEYRSLARERNVWLSVGGFHESSSKDGESVIYNCHILIDSEGQIKSVYRKMHLFDVEIPEKNVFLKESEMIQGGNEVVPPTHTPAGPLALAICYDLRFPELSTLQRKQGAGILTYPSAFTYATGLAHWEVLLRARAVENQCYVVAAAQYGKHNDKRVSFGQSLIVDPWGKVVAECPKYSEGADANESVAVAAVDAELLARTRREMPVFRHRRDDVYRLTLAGEQKFRISDDETFMFSDKTVPGCTVFYRTRHSFAFTNIRCVVPGHVLVSSIRPVLRLEDLSAEEVADLFQVTVKVQKVMESVQSSTSSTVCVQDGKDAGQTVPHVHVHVLPRKPNDFGRNDDIYDHLAHHHRDDNPGPVRSLGEMSEEAKCLRKYFS